MGLLRIKYQIIGSVQQFVVADWIIHFFCNQGIQKKCILLSGKGAMKVIPTKQNNGLDTENLFVLLKLTRLWFIVHNQRVGFYRNSRGRVANKSIGFSNTTVA